MAITLSRPTHFAALAFTQPEHDAPTGHYTQVASCGCAVHRRRVLGGPLSGHTYGDARYEVCDQHTRYCGGCDRQTWPHNDCVCDLVV